MQTIISNDGSLIVSVVVVSIRLCICSPQLQGDQSKILLYDKALLTVKLSLSNCMMRVLSLYESSFNWSNSAIASSNAYTQYNVNLLYSHLLTFFANSQAFSGLFRIS